MGPHRYNFSFPLKQVLPLKLVVFRSQVERSSMGEKDRGLVDPISKLSFFVLFLFWAVFVLIFGILV